MRIFFFFFFFCIFNLFLIGWTAAVRAVAHPMGALADIAGAGRVFCRGAGGCRRGRRGRCRVERRGRRRGVGGCTREISRGLALSGIGIGGFTFGGLGKDSR
jgi:hypothetical protein